MYNISNFIGAAIDDIEMWDDKVNVIVLTMKDGKKVSIWADGAVCTDDGSEGRFIFMGDKE